MADTANRLESLRLNRRETGRLGLVLALSLAAHLVAISGYKLSQELHLLPSLHLLTNKLTFIPPLAKNQEQPLEFVMVERPTTEAPENAKYYSSQNSRAANPNPADLTVPKINGKQTEVPKTETVPKPDLNKPQPAPQPVNREQAEPTPVVQPGDLVLANPKASQQQQQQQPERPRTLAQALPHQLPGLLMRQDGGVSRQASTPSLDVKLTGFGAYDEALVEAVSQRWYNLLDSQQFALDRTGKVVLQFTLHYDGRVTDMKIAENTVGDLLGYVCEKAVNDPAPFAPWSSDMRLKLGDSRPVQFTFYYQY